MEKEKAISVLKAPENLELLFTDDRLSGFSGRNIIALLQNLAVCLDPQNEAYLEIGVYRGMSLLSVSKVFKGLCFGIDNFSQFDPEKKNYGVIKEHCSRLNIENVILVNDDFEEALRNLDLHTGNKRIGLLFIDGPHDYRSQLMCLLLARQHMSENAIIVIDDSNYRHVRQANSDFLVSDPSYRLALERYTGAHPGNMSPEEKKKATEGWWNGINVIVSESFGFQSDIMVKTMPDKVLFYNDHQIHSSRYADCAPEAMAVTHALRPFRPLKLADRIYRLYRRIKRSNPLFHGKYRHLNTYTDDLV